MPAAAAVATCIAMFTLVQYPKHYLAVSDGTPAGTETIVRIEGPAEAITQAGKKVVFIGRDRDHGSELWTTDGTGAGTGLLKKINRKPNKSSDLGYQLFDEIFASSGRRAIFPAEDAHHGREIWVTDGTSAGTRLLKDFAPGRDDGIDENEYYGYDYIASNGGRAFFLAHDGNGDSKLWSTTGTKESTQRAVPGNLRGDKINHAGAVGRSFLFVYDDRELWTTGGTARSAKLLKRFDSSVQFYLGPPGRNDFALLDVVDPAFGSEPWVTDGTPEGTVLLKDIEPGSVGSFPRQIFDGENYTLFTAETSKFGAELWVTRGDAASTRLLMDITPGEESTEIGGYARLKNKVVFSAFVREGAIHRDRLFITDGTPQGTRQLSSKALPSGSFLALADRVLFGDYRVDPEGSNIEIWATFGEPGDEVQVSHFAETNPNFTIWNMAAVEVLRDAKRATPCPD